jgi:hypothetical protein
MKRLLMRIAIGAAVWVAWQTAALACPICFQTNDAHVTGSVRAAVGVLIAVTVGVVGVAVVFFGRVMKRQ